MKIAARVFAAIGLILLSYWVITFMAARRYQAAESQRLINESRTGHDSLGKARTSDAPAGTKPEYPSTGSAIGLLAIPRLAVSIVAVEGAGDAELRLGPGHIRGTSLPGAGGNVGIAGHRDTFFRPLRHIRESDIISFTTQNREYRYKVVATRVVSPSNVRVLYPTERETLTLVTCFPFDFIGAAPSRFIVRAECLDCAQ